MTLDRDKLAKQMHEDFVKRGEALTDEDAQKAVEQMYQLADLMFDVVLRQTQRDARLRKEPQGFPLDHGGTCCICRNGIAEDDGWYDHNGQKCLICQKALNDGVVPSYVCKNEHSYYTMYDLNSKFEIKTQRVKKHIKEGVIIARTILDEERRVHHYLFLKAENPKLAACEHFNPVWKSKKRHEDKVREARGREKDQKIKEELLNIRKLRKTAQ